MMTICKEDMCVGCKACVDICNQNAINICDGLDRYNAIVDETRCIKCGVCYNVCQQNKDISLSEPIIWKQGWRQNQELRERSSSGGLAAELMHTFLMDKGIVCSCRFRDGKFGFEFVENEGDIYNFSGSKYVKSDPNGIYKIIKNQLIEGKKVLFIGLPCQVAAVKLFCGEKVLDLLYTVDLICHGTPSPQLLNLFLEEHNYSLSEVSDIRFRKKENFKLYLDSHEIFHEKVQDMYTFAFLKGIDYTENCYSCKFARKERVSDITIGDSWGSELPVEEREKGISLIMCQTQKGIDLLNKLKIHTDNVDINRAIIYNKQLQIPTKKLKERKLFFEVIKEKKSFNKAVLRCFPKQFYKQKVKYVLIKLKIIT